MWADAFPWEGHFTDHTISGVAVWVLVGEHIAAAHTGSVLPIWGW